MTSLTFGNHLKFGQDSCHTSKDKPTFLHREREHSKLRVNCTHYMRNHWEGPPTGPTRAGASPRRVVEWRPNDDDFPLRSRPGVDNGFSCIFLKCNFCIWTTKLSLAVFYNIKKLAIIEIQGCCYCICLCFTSRYESMLIS